MAIVDPYNINSNIQSRVMRPDCKYCIGMPNFNPSDPPTVPMDDEAHSINRSLRSGKDPNNIAIDMSKINIDSGCNVNVSCGHNAPPLLLFKCNLHRGYMVNVLTLSIGPDINDLAFAIRTIILEDLGKIPIESIFTEAFNCIEFYNDFPHGLLLILY